MKNFTIVFTTQACKDSKKLKQTNLKENALAILEILEKDPFQNPPPFKALVGELKGCYSRRINIQHRIVYEVFTKEKVVKVLRMWTHYE